MRKSTIISALVLGLTVGGLAWAAKTDKSSNTTAVQEIPAQVLIYSAASSQKVIDKVAPNAQLVPFFQQGEWVKVGDPRNGKVGWINKEQYQKARETFFRPDIQTVYINVDQNKKGKPTLNIVAYKNGKKLSQKEADGLYKRMREQQEEQFVAMQRMDMNMDHMFDQDMHMANQMVSSGFFNPSWAQHQPVVVITNPSDKAHKAEKKAWSAQGKNQDKAG